MSDDLKKYFAVPSGEATLAFIKMTRGGVVFGDDVAIKIGEALCKAHYGKEELAHQKPLLVFDKEAYWRVEGSWNRDGKVEGDGAFFVSIEKYDGRVTDIGKWHPYRAHPSVVPLIKQHIAKKKREEEEKKKGDDDKK
jgi:hypothetical protein